MNALPSPQQLRYLLALADLGHFGRAAAACAVSQSTLSAGILALEHQLDATILDRCVGRHGVFTALGEEIVASARKALTLLESVAEAAVVTRLPPSGPLRLGVIPTVGPFLLPSLMPALRNAFPRLQLFVREEPATVLLERMAANRLDLLLLALPCGGGDTETLAVLRDPLVLALPKGHRLARADRVPVAALAAERMLLLEEGHCLRDQALALRGAAGEPEAFAATSLHALAQMVAGGLGVTLLPRMAVEAGVAAGADVVLRPLSGAAAWRTIGLAWQARSPRAAEYRALATLIVAPGPAQRA